MGFWRPSRGLVLVLPLLLVLGGIRLSARTPLDFSSHATVSSKVPMWALSIDFVLLGVPFIVAGLWAFRRVWIRTAQQFRVDVAHAPLGFGGTLPTVLALFLASVNPHSMFSYSWSSPGGLQGGIYSMLATLVFASLWAGIMGVFLFLYVTGIVSEGSGKYDKRAGETDAVGRLIDEMKGSRTG